MNGSDAAIFHRTMDAIALITIVVLANVIHVKCGDRWPTRLEEIKNPATLLIIQLVRQCRAAMLREDGQVLQLDLGFSMVWCVVATFWLF